MRNSFTGRRTSGSSVSTTAAITEPLIEPMPPSTTMAITSMLRMNVNELGFR